jgi:hypothetical protein
MRTAGCYRGLADAGDPEAPPLLDVRARVARALAGVAIIASVGVLYTWPIALLPDLGVPGVVVWALAVPSLWLGVSHLVAAATDYRGCPEIGAIPSLVLRRRVVTTCRPWERLDRRIEPGS